MQYIAGIAIQYWRIKSIAIQYCRLQKTKQYRIAKIKILQLFAIRIDTIAGYVFGFIRCNHHDTIVLARAFPQMVFGDHRGGSLGWFLQIVPHIIW